MRAKVAAVALSVVCLGLTALVWAQRATIERLSRREPTYKTDEPFVFQAIGMWARKVEEDRRTVMKNRYPVAVHLPGETCVELRLVKGSAGGSPTYCFDQATHKPTRIADNVE